MPEPDGPPGPYYAGEAAELDDDDINQILGFDMDAACEPVLPQEIATDLANCVLRVIREKFDSDRGGTKPSKRLAAKRAAALRRADATMSTQGFTLADVQRLERDYEIRLQCFDTAGNKLLKQPPATGRAARHLVVNVTLHDHHGWSSLPVDPPAITTVVGFDEDTERALEVAAKIADAEKADRASTAALLNFVAAKIPRGTRSWICGAELVTHRGALYRSKAAALAIDNALEDLTGIHPREFDGFLESCVKGDQDMKAFNVIEEHGKAVNSIGGASAYRFRKWLDREEIKPTPNNMRDI